MNQINTVKTHLWDDIKKTAVKAGLDPEKFGPVHREVVDLMVESMLNTHFPTTPSDKSWSAWLNGFNPLRRYPAESETTSPAAVRPIIICGVPGTGKTTFLYVLDTVFRRMFALPDLINPQMTKEGGRSHTIPKRHFLGRPISLLSVRRWAELLHFFAWDIERHRFDAAAQEAFIAQTLRPMRLILADEVEMTGYSPTIPEVARHGLLVVGTSNQTEFKQLESEQIPAHIFFFEGVDMRVGDPDDAVVTGADPLRRLFDQTARRPAAAHGPLPYQTARADELAVILADFKTAVQVPFLESQWVDFFQTAYKSALGPQAALKPESQVILLLEQFSLDALRTDFNGIIRFVSLFDAIEQLCLGVLVGHPHQDPVLSREALQHMKVTVHAARGVTEAVKKKTVVGVDRAASRIGQAGYRAREWILNNKPETEDKR